MHHICHVAPHGGRGVDFAMKKAAIVIIIKDVSTLSELRQYCGRGARRHDHRCDVYMCVPTQGVLAGASAETAEDALEGRLLNDSRQAKYKIDVCEKLHGKRSKTTNPKKRDMALSILNDARFEIHADEGVLDKSPQIQNYGIVRDVWGGLPSTVEELQDKNIW